MSLNDWLMITTWRLTGCHHTIDQSALTWAVAERCLKTRKAPSLLNVVKDAEMGRNAAQKSKVEQQCSILLQKGRITAVRLRKFEKLGGNLA